MICLGVVVVCCVLTGIYIKRNTLKGNVEVKKAVAKILVYLTIVSVITFVTGLLPAASPAIRKATREGSGGVAEITVDYILRVIYNINSFLTPIMAIVFLRPVRIALKEIGKVIFLCGCIRKHRDTAVNLEMTRATAA